MGRDHESHVERDQGLRRRPADLASAPGRGAGRSGSWHHLADLIEEQRSPLGHLEPAGPLTLRSGERALLVTEQLALDQAFGQRPDIDGDEGTVRGGG